MGGTCQRAFPSEGAKGKSLLRALTQADIGAVWLC